VTYKNVADYPPRSIRKDDEVFFNLSYANWLVENKYAENIGKKKNKIVKPS